MAKRKRTDTQTKLFITKDGSSKQSVLSGLRESEDNVEDELTRFEIPLEGKAIMCARKGSGENPALVCTHGAGGTIDSPAMLDFLRGFDTFACFNGNMNMKSRVKSFHAVINHTKARKALGGRSMGARAAVATALEMPKKPEALVLVSYPLTAGKLGQEREPAKREQILIDLPEDIDVLFATGSEDKQCDLKLLQEIVERMKARTWVLEVKGADHGTGLKQKAGIQPIRAKMGSVAAEWLDSRDATKRYCAIEWNQTERRITADGWQNIEGLKLLQERKKT